MSRPLVLRWDELPTDRPQPGLSRSAVASDEAMVVYNLVGREMPPGPHHHPFAQIALFTRGHGTLVIDGAAYPVSAGTVAIIPSDAEHSLTSEGDEPLENIDVFVPVREDYRHLLGWMQN